MNEWLLIFAMMLVTFIPRYLPLALINNLALPAWLLLALPYIPIAVLSAIIAQNTFFISDQLMLAFDNVRLITAAVAVLVAIVTRSLLWTVCVGLLLFFLLSYWL